MEDITIWLILDFPLLISLIITGLFVERVITRKADAAITKLDGCPDSHFSTWIRNMQKRRPRLLAVILTCPLPLCYAFAGVLIFLILPFPLPAESATPFLLLTLFFLLISWSPHVVDRVKKLKSKVLKSTQEAGV